MDIFYIRHGKNQNELSRYTIICLYEQANEQANEQAGEQAKAQADEQACEHNKLNKIKLFNYLLLSNIKKSNENFEDGKIKLNFSQRSGLIRILKNLDLYIENEVIRNLMSEEEIEEYQILYYAIAAIYCNSYKVYIKNLKREVVMQKLLETMKNCSKKSSDEKIRYLIASLQNELKSNLNLI